MLQRLSIIGHHDESGSNKKEKKKKKKKKKKDAPIHERVLTRADVILV